MEIRLTNRYLSVVEAIAAQRVIQENFEIGRRSSPSEYKTSNELDLVLVTNTVLRQEFEELGIGDLFEDIDPSRIHFLDKDEYQYQFPGSKGDAVNVSHLGMLEINRNYYSENPYEMVFIYLHEAIHLTSFNRLRYDPEKGVILPKEVGFSRITNSPIALDAFVGFNEAVCDLSARRIQEKYIKLFYPDVEPTDQHLLIGTYPQELEVLEAIVEGIADFNSESPVDVWLRFYKAQFTGDISSLKEVERVFGNGSLRILARLGLENLNENLSDEQKSQIKSEIRDYFIGKRTINAYKRNNS